MFLILLFNFICSEGNETTPTPTPIKVKCGLLFGCLFSAALLMVIIGAIALQFMKNKPSIDVAEYNNIEECN